MLTTTTVTRTTPLCALALVLLGARPPAAVSTAPPDAAPAEAAPVQKPAPDSVQRPVPTPHQRALDQGEFAELRKGVPAASVALDLPAHGAVRIEVVRASLVTDDFELETARIVRGTMVRATAAVELPNAYEGRVEGLEDSCVFLGFGTGAASDIVAGFVRIGDESWWISSGPLEARRAGLPTMIAHRSAFAEMPLDGFSCGTPALEAPPAETDAGADGGVAGGALCREFRVAIETDTEFTTAGHGGNATAAAQYALLLMGAASQIHNRDLDVKLPVSYLRIWTGEDPWTSTDMIQQLYQYHDHWVANMGSVPREIGHYFSGRGLGGGVAWLGVACSAPDLSYSLTSPVGYGFPYPLVDYHAYNWEPKVVSHEIGHNFGAPHTHDYTPPVDACGLGDCTNAYGGTIMSYCNSCPGGLSNITLRFHAASVDSMLAHLATVACGEAGARAVDDIATTNEGTAIVLAPLENDAFVNCSSVSLASFASVTAAGGTVALVPGSATTLRYTPPAGFSGTDSFGYAIRDAASQTSSATVRVEVRRIVQQVFVEGAQAGVTASWYALPGATTLLPDFSTLTPYASTTLPAIDIPSTSGQFSTSGRSDGVAAVFAGYLVVPTTGIWTLSTESDDGSRLLIGGQPVVVNDGLHGMVERSVQVALEAGLHPFRVEFFENLGGAGLIVRWRGPGVARQPVPASAFRSGGTLMRIDLDGDGTVGAPDLATLLSAWGPAGPSTAADFNRDGTVGSVDLSYLLNAWGQ